MCWKRFGLLLLLGMLLTACGNKGPLVMPDAGVNAGANKRVEKTEQGLAD